MKRERTIRIPLENAAMLAQTGAKNATTSDKESMHAAVQGSAIKSRGSALWSSYMRTGTIIRVVPDTAVVDWLNECEIDFGDGLIGMFYENQLRLVKAPGY
jgi:hypothetical protein